jgi:divalent metal cation (Fe/Co/Zn/Cd) transporter
MENLYKKAVRLEYFTIGYNLLEAAGSIIFGLIASSIALFGFGLDSVVESLSGIVILWRFLSNTKEEKDEEEKREKRAIRFVSVTFFLLAAYIVYESTTKLIEKEIPLPSFPGIIISLCSLIVMPVLAYYKYKIGKQINSKALMADSKESLVCAFLSLAIFIGLGSNYLFGFWQADPITGFIIAGFLIVEGKEVWEEAGEENDNT